jgi:hypothetical protein
VHEAFFHGLWFRALKVLAIFKNKCFDVPTPKIVRAFVLGLDDEQPVCVIQLEVELHLLVEDIISSVSAEACDNLYFMWPSFSSSCSHLGRQVVALGIFTLLEHWLHT